MYDCMWKRLSAINNQMYGEECEMRSCFWGERWGEWVWLCGKIDSELRESIVENYSLYVLIFK